jgi:hypothetical protein
MTSKKSSVEKPPNNSPGQAGSTMETANTRFTLTPEEQRHVYEIDFRFGPDPQPKCTADDAKERKAWFEAEMARLQNEVDIVELRNHTPARARVEKRNGGVDVRPARYTPSGYRELMTLLGHSDADLVQGLLAQLGMASTTEQGIDEASVNFLLSFIKNLKPRDGIEVLLAAQMGVVHQAAMKSANRLNRATTWQDHDSTVRALTQLNRTYVAQTDAFKHYRTGGEQKVTVQHVSVNDGGQAIVAQLTQAAPPAVDCEPAIDGTKALPRSHEQPMDILADRDPEPAATVKAKRK